ncbi:MAG TPA: SUMF1/EgtB/PvdO family nonheme iron enzyme [Planctomycetota bacterium]|nr:SUMF1/EgtB/PvdO family nonheme iron enzyme [Planctomycetota bacterium]
MLRQRVLEALVTREAEPPAPVAMVELVESPSAPTPKRESSWVAWTSVGTSLLALLLVVIGPSARKAEPTLAAHDPVEPALPRPPADDGRDEIAAREKAEARLIDLELDLARHALEEGDVARAASWAREARRVSNTGLRWRAIQSVFAAIEERERRAPLPVAWSDRAPAEPEAATPAAPPPGEPALVWVHAGDDDPDAFFIQKDPVTNADYKKFVADGGYSNLFEDWEGLDPEVLASLANGPCRWNHGVSSPADDAPVRDVTWREARAYARWLSRKTGGVYRLPSAKERERLHLSAFELDRMKRAETPDGETSQHLDQGFRLVRVPR